MDSVSQRAESKSNRPSAHVKEALTMSALAILPISRLAQNLLVLRLLSECIAVFKLSTMIPKIFENPLTVYTRLRGTEYEPCARMLLKYLKERDKNLKITVGGPEFYDDKLISLINTLQRNYRLIELLPNWLHSTTTIDHSIMEAFDLLRNIVEQRLYRSAIIEVNKEKEMHKDYRANMLLRKEIEHMRGKLRTQKQRHRWRRVLRSSGVFKYQDVLNAKRWEQFKEVGLVLAENSQRIKTLRFGHPNRINQLEEEANTLENEYKKLKITHAKQLKTVREEKNKFLIQLQNVIEKYDRVLGEKIKENVYLQDEFDKQRKEMDLFMIDYSVLEREYNEIVTAELAEKEREWNARANFFFQTRAVKILQRYWRKYLKEHQKTETPKKSGIKGKGKGKARG